MQKKTGAMPEPLETILAALFAGDYVISGHVWENYVLEDDRPDPDELVRAIIRGDPRIRSHDRNNPRGSSCDLDVVDTNARPMVVSVGYATRPVTIITAYYE